ncbi:metallophosphoesterase family protein [Oceanobacillus kimchii]|uniref:Serine/threonine protein phosphatase n=1 Tax=Oceanobacillus kimchii TaxID=746691 RepID=A0ABQ5TKQ2_9BACI|nr:metallophosphoesterase family protein [Oceanobacillus kimchii]GLO66284.1 serine/threonine protein phosphatase [Oceanobacillus kimchii]
MRRILAISDIHGCYNELVKLLDEVNYKPEVDQLILLGDYIDRGTKNKEVVQKVMNLVDEGAIALRGNHDQMFLDFLYKNNIDAQMLYLQNGGLTTLESYVGYEWFDDGITPENLYRAKQFIQDNYKEHLKFLYHLPYYHQIGNLLFVHAGINPLLEDWRETSDDDMIWIREKFLYSSRPNDNLRIIHGHTPAQYLHSSNGINFTEKRVGIDGACAYGGQLNCLIIESGEFTQMSIKR